MSLDPSSMSLDLSSMSLDRSSMSLDPLVKTILGRPMFHLTCQEFHLGMSPVSIESRPERQRWTGWLCGILGFKRESRPYMQRGGIKTGEKGHDSYKKSRVPFGPEMQLLDKKTFSDSSVRSPTVTCAESPRAYADSPRARHFGPYGVDRCIRLAHVVRIWTPRTPAASHGTLYF
ncbi:hypothetical protein TNCV_4294601 [Trichonephila clavipes]|uniref:Uncharacterized protein n=1 Tax=Trichonephila clavipes TaxID=2585209 RepID=A0A8X6RMW8_TRICX|nr:hypothetical protein TNCV_4294601 [Trichonephila clavipes]